MPNIYDSPRSTILESKSPFLSSSPEKPTLNTLWLSNSLGLWTNSLAQNSYEKAPFSRNLGTGSQGQTAQKVVKFLLRLLKLDPERIMISLYGQQNQYSVEVGRKGERVRASWHPPDVALCRMKYWCYYREAWNKNGTEGPRMARCSIRPGQLRASIFSSDNALVRYTYAIRHHL